jgi:hypothetical protein
MDSAKSATEKGFSVERTSILPYLAAPSIPAHPAQTIV